MGNKSSSSKSSKPKQNQGKNKDASQTATSETPHTGKDRIIHFPILSCLYFHHDLYEYIPNPFDFAQLYLSNNLFLSHPL
jgi:hypothetical protein